MHDHYTFYSYEQVELVIEFEPGLNEFVDKLRDMREASSRVILLYAK